jgi:transposase
MSTVDTPAVTDRRAYPCDISDARWALIAPSLTTWRQACLDRRPTAEPAATNLRDIFDAILYVNRTGIPWKYLPHDFPNYRTVYGYYAAWRDEGIFAQLNYDLTGLARARPGASANPAPP